MYLIHAPSGCQREAETRSASWKIFTIRRSIRRALRQSIGEPPLGEAFPLQCELDGKLAQLAEIEADVASTEGVVTENGSAQPRAIAA